MTDEVSVVIIVPAATHADLEKVFCAWGKSDLPGYSFTVALSATGSNPATHYAMHEYTNTAMAALYTALPTSSGTLPAALDSVTWDDWGGLTELRAIAAVASVDVFTASGSTGATANFTQAKSEMGLQTIISGP